MQISTPFEWLFPKKKIYISKNQLMSSNSEGAMAFQRLFFGKLFTDLIIESQMFFVYKSAQCNLNFSSPKTFAKQ